MFSPELRVKANRIPELCEIVIKDNLEWLRERNADPNDIAASLARVAFRREPKGRDVYRPIGELLALGYGDCEDLVCAWASLFRMFRVDARAMVIKQPGKTDHVVMRVMANGSWHTIDPSPFHVYVAIFAFANLSR